MQGKQWLARSTTLNSGLTPLLTLPRAAPFPPSALSLPQSERIGGAGGWRPRPRPPSPDQVIQFLPEPQRGCKHPMALPSFHRQAPLESTLSRALGKAGIDSKGGEDSFKTTFFFHFHLLGSMDAGALLWVGSRVMGRGLEKVKSCFHQLRPAGKKRTALK